MGDGNKFEAVTCGCTRKTVVKVPHSLLHESGIALGDAASRVATKQNLQVPVARAGVLAAARKLGLHHDWTT